MFWRTCRPDDYEQAKGKYIIDTEIMKLLPKNAVVMHPLPRVDEVCGMSHIMGCMWLVLWWCLVNFHAGPAARGRGVRAGRGSA